MYAVHKEGYYRHECVGVFDSKEKAIQAAQQALEEEPDDYHCFVIYQYQLNEYGTETDIETHYKKKNRKSGGGWSEKVISMR